MRINAHVGLEQQETGPRVHGPVPLFGRPGMAPTMRARTESSRPTTIRPRELLGYPPSIARREVMVPDLIPEGLVRSAGSPDFK